MSFMTTPPGAGVIVEREGEIQLPLGLEKEVGRTRREKYAPPQLFDAAERIHDSSVSFVLVSSRGCYGISG
jgi:hypothetical protein